MLTLLEWDSIVDVNLGDQVERKLTIMFSGIRNFTPLSEPISPKENFNFINFYLSQMEPVVSRHRGIIDKYRGNAIMALFMQGSDDAVTRDPHYLSFRIQRLLFDWFTGHLAKAGRHMGRYILNAMQAPGA
jgi:class 3 adenylate cyclase